MKDDDIATVAKQFNYFDNWRDQDFNCAKCGWYGRIDLQDTNERSELFDFHCPKCTTLLAIVTYPTWPEIESNWDKLSPEDKNHYKARKEREDEFQLHNLTTPAQLPEIVADSFVLVWDFEVGEKGEYGPIFNTILHDGQVIWRETAFYESYDRFIEIVDILEAKYGNRFKDLIPTARSRTYLSGDSISAGPDISRRRSRLAATPIDSDTISNALVKAGDWQALNWIRYKTEFESHHLQSPEQLPNIDGDAIVIDWDLAELKPRVTAKVVGNEVHYSWDQGGDDFLYVTLLHESREIWKEAAAINGYVSDESLILVNRYTELALLLKEKYGARMRDMVPSLRSSAYIGGFREQKIEQARADAFPT